MTEVTEKASLDEDDDLMALVESKTFVPVSLMTPERAAMYREAARRTMNEPRVKISLRVPETDLLRLKARAMREGIPYQTLINAILHQAAVR
jgi:predicted DNA binding CopG/RHH family protein